jgi:hypothetical protein
MEPITFDMKDAQEGSTKHRLVSVFDKIRKIISNIKLKEILLLLGTEFQSAIGRAIHQQRPFGSSISSLPPSREPFFIKYSWILEDIVV